MSLHSEAKTAARLIIEPPRGWEGLELRDLWRYRGLLYFLTWRDVKVRYKQTLLGAAWAVLQPVLTMLIFSIIFGQLAKLPSEGIPYPIFTYTALLPWQLFAFALVNSSNSLVGSQNLVSKVYFPRLVIPIASVLPGLVDFAISFVVLVGMMVFYQVPLTPRILALPLLLVPGSGQRPGGRSLAFCAECAISRCAVRGPVPDALLAICNARGLLQHTDSCKVAAAVRSQPHDGRGRGLSLGPSRQGGNRWPDLDLRGHRAGHAFRRHGVLPTDGSFLCGRDLR